MWRSRLDTRLARLERQDPEQAWLYQEGISALLAYAKLHRLQPWDMPALNDAESQMGFAQLLREAKEWRAREAHEP